METQCQLVADYMKRHGSITQLQANYDLGVSRLSGRIFDLKRKGYVINDRYIKVIDRYGKKTEVKEYWIVGEVKQWQNAECSQKR